MVRGRYRLVSESQCKESYGGHDTILPVLLGAHAARTRLTTPKEVVVVLVAKGLRIPPPKKTSGADVEQWESVSTMEVLSAVKWEHAQQYCCKYDSYGHAARV